jgi:hypothetical protein
MDPWLEVEYLLYRHVTRCRSPKKPRQRGGTPLAFSTGYNERMAGRDDMKPTGPGVKLTYDDYLLFPEDGMRHELIDGEHYVTPSPNRKHQAIAWNLTVMIFPD